MDELDALTAIYADDGFTYCIEELKEEALLKLDIMGRSIRLKVPISGYPYPDSMPFSGDNHVNNIITQNWRPGCECLFQVIEDLRDKNTEILRVKGDPVGEENYVIGHEEGEIDAIIGDSSFEISKGPIVEVNRSKFQAFVSKVRTIEDVEMFRALVTSSKTCARATHNIFAYRFYDCTTGVLNHDCDDDGESAAGGRLSEMLRIMDMVDDSRGIEEIPGQGVAVVVTRWYGGVKLGPDRFKIINNTARDLLESLEYVPLPAAKRSRRKKK